MAKDIISIKLKFSCQENWDDMQTVEGGRHCNKCNHKVYDFTNTKADEFRKIMDEFPGTCGIYRAEQVISAPLKLPFWNKWISAAMLLLGFNFAGCYRENNPLDIVVKENPKPKKQDILIGKAMIDPNSNSKHPHLDQVWFPPPGLKKNTK